MKRIIIKTSMFLFMMLTLLFQFNISEVSAEEKQVVSYYQAIVGDSADPNNFAGFTAVSQYYYKNSGKIGDSEDTAISSRASGYNDFSESGKCENIFNSASVSTYCKDKNIKSPIVKLAITNTGNVEIYVGNNASISSLRFFYIIANKSNQVQLFCKSNGEICENSKVIRPSDNTTNWKDLTRSGGTMVYSSNNLQEDFEVKHHTTGATTYYKFNVVTNMKSEYADLAKKYGVYVITSMTVSYVKNNTTYNYYLNNKIDEHTFSTVENLSASALNNVHICSKENIKKENGCVSYPNSVAKAAVLVKPLAEDDVTNTRAYNDIMYYLEDVIIPVAKIVIILLFLVVGTSTIITIVKSSDEPETRHSAIKKLITMFISAVVIYVVLMFWKPIADAISGWFG